MMTPQLFFGLKLDAEFDESIASANSALVTQLISNEGYYLSKLDHQNERYLGKWVSNTIYLEELDNAQNHIISILKQLSPNYQYQNNKLVLIPVIQ